MLRVTMVLGAIVYVPSLLIALETGHTAVVVTDTVVMALVILLNVTRWGRFVFRAVVFCGLIYGLGAVLLVTVGPVAQIYLLGFSLLSTILLGSRAGIATVALNTATLLAVGWLGFAPPAMAVHGWEQTDFVWLVLTSNFTLVNALLAVTLGAILSALEATILREYSANEDLRASEERFRELAENIGEVFYSLEIHSRRMLYVSPRSLEVWGLEPITLYQEAARLLERIHADDRDAFIAWWAELSNGGDSRPIDYRVVDPDDSIRWIRDTAYPVRDETGKVCRFVGTARDCSSERALEQERASLDEQLRQSQKMDAIGKLAGGIAHDFNNMLGVILGSAEMASDALEDHPGLRENIEQIQQAALRSSDLTRQLLAFARRQPIAPEVLDLNLTLQSMTGMLSRLVGEAISIEWEPTAGELPVLMDPTQVDQVLVNLVINARDAIDGVGIITIGTSSVRFDADDVRVHPELRAGTFAALSVRDTGSGMDESIRNRVFEPFFTTKSSGQGTGLGLATVYGIARQNGGMVNVYSEPGQGTVFRIYLPLQEPSTADRAPRVVDGPAGGSETILFLEDEPALLSLGTRQLEQLGYRVLPARLPSEAIALADGFPEAIHLLLSDVVMPEMNGRQVFEHLQVLRPTLRCLYISGYTSDILSPQGVPEGGAQFLEKPFSLHKLAEKVRQAIGS